ncbi:MAG: MBL fold metallo-hydrolase [Oscillospiraceae bacterium]|nr:MBL fold metallo-hydrolase [Oscillospiraceae bacterium]
MRFISFASGSSGNCALISEGETNILLDAGISARRIRDALAALGLSPGDISAVAVTHEHSDHIGGLKAFLKAGCAKVYTSRGTAAALVRSGADAQRIHTLRAGETAAAGLLTLTPFATPHDSAESFGYVFEGGGGRLAVITDLGCVTPEVERAAEGCGAAVLEANHDEAMLRSGPYPYYLKERILGSRGHLSNESCAAFAEFLAGRGMKRLMLAHLSAENNTRELALRAVEERLRGFPADTAPRAAFSAAIEV